MESLSRISDALPSLYTPLFSLDACGIKVYLPYRVGRAFRACALRAPQVRSLPDGHIRLLALEHTESDPIRCTLKAVDQDTNPLYNGLSYTWGDPRPDISQKLGLYDVEHTIYINGFPKRVQANLYHMLLRLRLGCPATTSPIWIDALCINQGDADEKAVQVSRMDEIYKGANAVFAWLGETDDYTNTGFQMVYRMASLHHEARSDYSSHLQRGVASYDFDEWEWTSLIATFRRAWFLRVWVIQEVYFARRLTIISGNALVSGDVFAHATDYLMNSLLWQKLLQYRMIFTPHEHRRADGPGIQAPGGVMFALQHSNTDTDTATDTTKEAPAVQMKRMLLLGRGSKASNRKDQIYALYGLIKESIRLHGQTQLILPAIDYTDIASVSDIFTEWTKFMIGEEEDFGMFSWKEDSSHRSVTSLPSWVPDMTVSMMPLSLRTVRGSGSWRPFGNIVGGWYLFSDDPRTIEVPGARFDVVTGVNKDFYSFNGTEDQVSVLQFIEPVCAASDTSLYPNVLEALARAITADSSIPAAQSDELAITLLCWMMTRIFSMGGEVAAMFAPIQRMAAQNFTIRQTFSRFGEQIRSNAATQTRKVQEFEMRSKILRSCRRLIRTRKGYLGIAGVSANVGDEVWVLPGSITPFVMRRKIDRTYELVGEAYVQGIMDGEVADSLRWEEIRIS